MVKKAGTTDATKQPQMPWWWRRRVGLMPIYGGLAACVAALASFAISPGQTAFIVCLVGLAAMWGTQAKWVKKKDRAMRNFIWAVIVAVASFILVVRNQMIDTRTTLCVLVGCVVLLGMFWWLDEWNRKRVHIERDTTERWPVMAEKLTMPRVRRGPVQETETGRKWRFWWDAGDFTKAAFKSRARELESALGIPEGRIRFEDVKTTSGLKDPNAIVVMENTEADILKGSVKFDHPTMARFTDEMFIGYREDNSKHKVVWYHEEFGGLHTLAAGATGSGKSGLYNLVLAESAYCPDLVRWGIDAKGGMALRPWAPLFDWLLTDTEDDGAVYWMLSALKKLLDARSKHAAEQGWSCWQPSAEHPVLLLVVDEAAEVFGLDAFDVNALLNSVARMGRAAGVLLLIATQHPTVEAIGSTQLTRNIRRRFCFSVEDQEAQRIVIPKSTTVFDASEIPVGPDHAGSYYCSEGGVLSNLLGRVRFVTKIDTYRIVHEVAREGSPVPVGDLDDLSIEACRRGSTDEESGTCHYDGRRIWTANDMIKPKGWVDEDEQAQEQLGELAPPAPANGAPGAPAPAPVHAPVAAYAPAPAHLTAVAPPGAPDETGIGAPIPWREGDPIMNLEEMVAPRTDEERAALAAAAAQYAAQFAEDTVTPEQAQVLLNRLLDGAGPEGISIAEMRKTLPRSSTWYSDELAKRMKASPASVVRVGTGRYCRPSRRLSVVGSDNGHSQ